VPPLRQSPLVGLGDVGAQLRPLVVPPVLSGLQQRWWCEELGLHPRYNQGKVEPLPTVVEHPAGRVVGARPPRGVVHPVPNTLAVGSELRRPGVIQAPMHSVQPGGVERRDTRAWRHGSDDRFVDIVDKFSQVPHIKVDKCPVNGNALFSTRDLDEPIQGWYHIEGMITFCLSPAHSFCSIVPQICSRVPGFVLLLIWARAQVRRPFSDSVGLFNSWYNVSDGMGL
jgi:hypothetical protein